ncbi:MAG: PKD domain-containing protein, partial [Novosphingobium sp.]|nr:PKD domain-containing protein [Novosphingobium sp.]
YTIRNGQVVPPAQAAERRGLQPVMTLTASGGSRAVVGVNQPVNLAGNVEMPPNTGRVVKYNWTVAGADEPATIVAKPLPLVSVNRTVTFAAPGTYVIRLTVDGQRDGLVNSPNQTLLQNFKEVRVVVQ